VNQKKTDDNLMRRVRFAGSWYEADPILLDKQLDAFLLEGKLSALSSAALSDASSVKAIVVPHAGYAYSGITAASAYAACQPGVKRVILLGPSHYLPFHGIGLSSMEAFETPLGNIPLDRDVMVRLGEHPLCFNHDEAHCLDHSLEMQLPFIKKVFPTARLVPLLVGELKDEEEIKALSSHLASFLDPEDLLVVSSDFTHYGPRFGYTPFQGDMEENIRRLDRSAYHFLEHHDLLGFLQFKKKTQTTICGFYSLALLISLLRKETQASLLAYHTSREAAKGETENSVSYLAIAFFE
jgi:AmmeMemoRadiSam system protein B